MSHLTLVPAWDRTEEDRTVPRLSHDWDEPVLDIPGLPAPTLSPMKSVQPGDPEPLLPEPDPILQRMLDEVDALFDGLDPHEMRAVGDGFYIDGDNTPRTRHGLLRVVEN